MTPEDFEAALAAIPAASSERRLGRLLRERRRFMGLTQREVARAAGLRNANFICMLEAGESKVPPERAAALAAALSVRAEPVVRRALLEHRPGLAALVAA